MSRMIRSRRAPAARDVPLYGRMLGLRHLAPSGFLCFVFFEGTVVLGILLALAELVNWWGVLVLPLTVAVMVKVNDVIAGALTRPVPSPPVRRSTVTPPPRTLRPAVIPRGTPAEHVSPARVASLRERTVDLRERGGAAPVDPKSQSIVAAALDAAALNGPPGLRAWPEELNLREQQARQSAARRYE